MAIKSHYLKPIVIIATILLLLLTIPFLILTKESIVALALYSNLALDHTILTLLKNSFNLVITTVVLSGIIAITLAWVTTYYDLPYKKLINILILLPLTIPSYILASTYAYIGEDQIPYFCDTVLNTNCNFSIRTPLGASIIFSLGLYPYLYLLTKNYFEKLKERITLAKLHGLKERQIIFKIAIPGSKPAIIAGLSLIAMEVMADFGLASLFGIKTFTTQIYRAWFYQNQYETAAFLSICLLAIVIIILLIEKFLNLHKSYTIPKYGATSSTAKKPKFIKTIFLLSICLTIPLFAFFIPFTQILLWGIEKHHYFLSQDFIKTFSNSLFLALMGSITIVAATILIITVLKTYQLKIGKILGNVVSLGYAVPGSVIAISVIYTLQSIFNQFGINYQSISILAIIGLIYAYFVRFVTLAHNNIQSSWAKIPNELNDISLIYQKNNLQRLNNIYIPFLSYEISISLLLIAVEIIKELPATLILRPFNFDTLSTRTYLLASDEMVSTAGALSLSIIAINLIPIYFINKFFLKNHSKVGSNE